MDKNATDDEIKRAFRQQAKKYHPDMNPGNKEAEAKFKEVNEAYEVLSDSNKRAQYDQFGHEGPNMGGGYGAGGFEGFGGFGGVEDIFETFFGGGMGGGRRSRSGPTRGSDLQVRIVIRFEEAAFGVKKDVTVTRNETCEACHGSGAKPGTEPKTCPTCHGTGQVRAVQQTILGQMQTQRTCETCHGTGKIVSDPCPECTGKGTVRRTRTITIDIPAGIDDGQQITLRGQGEPGQRGGPAGDLYVAVSVRPHAKFRRQQYDLHQDMNISFAQAALGDEVEVPTLEGTVSYKIPEGTQPGPVFRLRGQGVKNLRGSGKGDMYVRVQVEVPRRMNAKQKEALRAYDDAMHGRAGEGNDKRGKWKVKL